MVNIKLKNKENKNIVTVCAKGKHVGDADSWIYNKKNFRNIEKRDTYPIRYEYEIFLEEKVYVIEDEYPSFLTKKENWIDDNIKEITIYVPENFCNPKTEYRDDTLYIYNVTLLQELERDVYKIQKIEENKFELIDTDQYWVKYREERKYR